jgi:hypothetical protein
VREKGRKKGVWDKEIGETKEPKWWRWEHPCLEKLERDQAERDGWFGKRILNWECICWRETDPSKTYERSVGEIAKLRAEKVDAASSQEKGRCGERLLRETWVTE